MRVLFDHQIFSSQKYGGISRYFSELMKNFPVSHSFKLALIFSDNYYLNEKTSNFRTKNILPDKRFKGKYFLKKRLYDLNQCYSKFCISKNDFDLFHPTYYDNYFESVAKKPYVITVHDLILFKFENYYNTPEVNKIKSQMLKSINNSRRIIAISQFTKNDLVNTFGLNKEKIDIIYHGYSPMNKIDSSTFDISDLGRYLLFVGRRDPYKNFNTFTESIRFLLIKERNLKLICVGDPFNSEEIDHLKKLGIKDQIIQMNVSDSKLNVLYSKALAFVFPSLYEGFGMPILEAFSNNCPVCLSNSSCFPEIAGEAGAYFNPYDHSSIANTVERVIYDKNYSAELVTAGQKRLASFSWKKTLEETLNTYSKAVELEIN